MLEVGRVARAHGLTGTVVVDLWSNRGGRLDVGSVLWTSGRRLEVRASRVATGRHLVDFAGVADRTAAEALRGSVLTAPFDPEGPRPAAGSTERDPVVDPGADGAETLWVHELVGCLVEDLAGRPLGRVHHVEANPASDLVVLESGELVPLRFAVGGVRDGTLRVDPPTGLLSGDDGSA